MVILGTTTSGTPATTLDDTHVMISPYPTLEACVVDLKSIPVSDSEIATEGRLKVRVLRLCTLPQSDTYYSWADGHIIPNPGTVAEIGRVSPR